MTLYFTLFETISLFVTAFVVNFLVLDGRSNYLEGSLLLAAYIIIAYVSLSAPYISFLSYFPVLILGLTDWPHSTIPAATRRVK